MGTEELLQKRSKELARARTDLFMAQVILAVHADDGSIDAGVLEDICDAMRISSGDLPDILNEYRKENE